MGQTSLAEIYAGDDEASAPAAPPSCCHRGSLTLWRRPSRTTMLLMPGAGTPSTTTLLSCLAQAIRVVSLNSMDQHQCETKIRELFVANAQYVLAYALRRGASRPDAEDLVIETFLTCWRRLGDIADPDLPWLLAVTRRLLANQRRSTVRRAALERKILENGPTAPFHPPILPSDNELMHALAQLQEEDREVLLLTAWDGLTQEEVGQVIGCSRRTVIKKLDQARTKLGRLLQQGPALLGSDRTEE